MRLRTSGKRGPRRIGASSLQERRLSLMTSNFFPHLFVVQNQSTYNKLWLSVKIISGCCPCTSLIAKNQSLLPENQLIHLILHKYTYVCMSLASLSACSTLSGRAANALTELRSVCCCFDPVNDPKGPASTSIGLCSFLSPLFVQNQWGQGNASTGKMVLYCWICSFAGYSSHLESWLVDGMVGCGWPLVSSFSFRPENPPFCSNPPPPPPKECDRVWKRWSDNHLSIWPCGQRMVKRYPRESICELWFFSNCSQKQPSSRFCLDLDWHSLLWRSAHRYGIITIFITYHHNQSSALRNLTICSNLEWK